MLQSRDESELDRLTLLVTSLRRGVPAFQPNGLVRVRFQPECFGQAFPRLVVRVGAPTVLGGEASLAASFEHVDTDVGRDPVEARAQQFVSLEPWKRAPGPQQGFLQYVVGVEQALQQLLRNV